VVNSEYSIKKPVFILTKHLKTLIRLRIIGVRAIDKELLYQMPAKSGTKCAAINRFDYFFNF